MATGSFDRRFILKTEKEADRFYDTFFSKVKSKPINIISVSPEKEREAEKKLKHLLFL